MKKIFTLMFTATLFSSAFAQYNHGNGDDRRQGTMISNDRDRHDDDRYDYYAKKREADIQVARINQAYDCKIQEVRNRSFISYGRRSRWIDRLNDQRRDEIRSVYENAYSRGRHYDNDNGRRQW